MKHLIEFLIRRFLPGYHLHKDPVRKGKGDGVTVKYGDGTTAVFREEMSTNRRAYKFGEAEQGRDGE